MTTSLVNCLCLLFATSSATSQTTLNFQNLANMPTARGAITSAADENYFYVSNGFSSSRKYTGTIEKYDISKNEWSILTSSLIPKQFPSSAIIGNVLYVLNGDLNDGTLNRKMEVVNLSTGEISFSVDNPEPAHAAGVATWNGALYVFGGDNSHLKGEYSNSVFKFDPVAQKWTKLAKMPYRGETKGVIVEDKLYIIGGYDGEVSNMMYVYDLKTDKWNKLTKLPCGISANTVVASGHFIYTLFDYTQQTLIGRYDISSNTFTILQQNNMIGRRHAGAHILNDKLYIMGGNTGATMNTCISSLQVADLK